MDHNRDNHTKLDMTSIDVMLDMAHIDVISGGFMNCLKCLSPLASEDAHLGVHPTYFQALAIVLLLCL